MTNTVRPRSLAAVVSSLRRGPVRRVAHDSGTGSAPTVARDAAAGDALGAEHARLARGAGLERVHWCIIAASALLTLGAWQHSLGLVEARSADRFERESERVLDALGDRFGRYEDLVRAGAATLGSHGWTVSTERWRAFVDGLALDARYPDLSSIAVALPVLDGGAERFASRQRRRRPHFDVHPPRTAGEALVITHIEPEASMRHALGLDLYHEPVRRDAVHAGRDAAEPRLSAPLELVRRAGPAPGLVLAMPLYHRPPSALATVEARRDAFAGAIVVPFALEDLASGPLARDARHVGLRISDGGRALIDELGGGDRHADPAPLHRAAFPLEMHGRVWDVEIATDLVFRADVDRAMPRAVLAAGVGTDAALFALFALSARRGGRALACADRAVDELEDRMVALAESNAQLESFAHVVSHDLKSPVRGIGNLVEFLAEDLGPYLDCPDASPEVVRNLARLDEQHRRLTHLIDSLLTYCALGHEPVACETLDVRDSLDALADELGLDDGRLVVRGELPVFRTQAVRFEQVMRSLLENAVRHFEGDPGGLRVAVTVERAPGGWRVAVGDNGPGIPARFHETVFEVFRRLRPKDEVEGSGVGLSIVRRSLETIGGSVSLRSAPGEGATFELFWPGDEAGDGAAPDAEAPWALAA